MICGWKNITVFLFSLSLSLSVYFFLSFSYMSVDKLQRGGIDIYIYTIRRAIIDGRYISVS